MRSVAQLSSEEFFDFIFALSPILPVISRLEIVKTNFAFITNHSPTAKEVAEIKNEIEKRKDRKAATDAEIARNMQDRAKKNAELFTVLAKEIPVIVPFVTSRENRGAIYEAIGILDRADIDEIRGWPAPKLVNRVTSLFRDPGFGDFLDYAGPADTEKSPNSPQVSPDR